MRKTILILCLCATLTAQAVTHWAGFNGDSIGRGYGTLLPTQNGGIFTIPPGSGFQSPLGVMADAYPAVSCVVSALNGDKISNNTAATNALTMIGTTGGGFGTNGLLVEFGINDIFGNDSVANIETNFQAYLTNIRAVYPTIKIIGSTIQLVNFAPNEATMEPRRLAVNTWIRGWTVANGHANGFDIICDIAANSIIGDTGNFSNLTYYQPDGIHLTAAGYAIWESIMALSYNQNGLIANTYYVATTGNNANTGFTGSPWLTISKAASVMQPNDTTNIAGGTYAETITQSIAGAAGGHITFAGAGAGSVTTQGFTVSAPYIDISGINCNGAGVSSTDGCFEYTAPATHCTLTNCTVTGTSTITSGAKGVLVFQGADYFTALNVNQTNSNGHSWTLAGDFFSTTNCSVTSTNGWDVFQVVGHDGTIKGGTITVSNPGANPNHCDIWQTFGNDPTDVSRNVVLDSVIVALGTGYQLGTWTDDQLNGNISLWTMRNCLLVDVERVLNLNAPNCTFENDTFIRCGSGSSDAISIGFTSAGHSTGTTILNNLFYQCGTPTLTNQGWYAGDPAATGTTADYNTVIGTGAGTTKNNTLWTTGNGIVGTFEAHGKNGIDPVFVSPTNFALQASSPCKVAALDLSAFFTTDILGVTRPAGLWSMGAYQFIGSGNAGGSALLGNISIIGKASIH